MYKKILAFSQKEENKELLLHSSLALIIRVGGAAASFVMNIVIARYLGATESGYFFLAVTVSTIMVSIGRIGGDHIILRYVSIYNEKGEWKKVNGIMSKIMSWSLLATIIITVPTCIFSKQIAIYFFHKEQLHWSLFWVGLSMPFFTAFNAFGIGLQGRRKVLISVTLLKIATPFLLIALGILFSPKNGSSASFYYLVACALTFLLGYYWWKQNIPAGRENVESSLLWKSCLSLWIVAIMQQLVIWAGQFIAGIYNTPSELAQLAVARNTSVLITFILTAVNYVSAPRFASMYSEGRHEELKTYARNTTRLMTIFATPFLLIVWLFPGFIMSFFGKDFSGGIWLLRILALGQFINVISGSVGYLLMMTGYEKDMRNITVINGVLAVVLALILNPTFGAIGSAISTAVVVASSNLMAVGLVKKRLGFNTLSILGFK